MKDFTLWLRFGVSPGSAGFDDSFRSGVIGFGDSLGMEKIGFLSVEFLSGLHLDLDLSRDSVLWNRSRDTVSGGVE